MPEVIAADAETGTVTSTSSPMTDIKIVEQIEYYFGDFNMMRDKFLKQEVTKNEGWIPISILLRFNRLAALSKDVDVILSAFKNNESAIVEVNKETKSVRRNPDRAVPQPTDVWRQGVTDRTVYMKGFPTESTTMEDILNFMSTFGKVDNVYKRQYFDKALKEWKFKGSTFVAFPTKDEAEKFMAIGSVKYNGNELIRKWQKDYMDEKKNERLRNKIEAKETKNQLLKEQQEGFIKEMKKLPEGALISLSGLEEKIGLNDLKVAIINLSWDLSYVDYNVGESTAYVRLQTENSAKDAIAKLTDSSFEVKGITLEAQLVEGDEEKNLLEKMEAERKSRIMLNVGKFGKKGKSKKNKFGKRGRNGDSDGVTKEKEEKNDVSEEKMEAENDESKKDLNEANPSGETSEGVLKRRNADANQEETSTKKSKSDEK